MKQRKLVKMNNKANKIRLGSKNVVLAALIVGAFLTFLAAAPLMRTESAAVKQTAQPAPTPPDKPLDAASAAEFVQSLTDETENVLDDALDVDEVNAAKEKISTGFAKRGAMTGKTPKEIIDLYFTDVKSAVENAEVQKNIFTALSNLLAGNTPVENPPSDPPKTTPVDPPKTTPTDPPVIPTRPGTNAALRQYIRSLTYDPQKLLAVAAEGGSIVTDEPKGDPKKTRKTGDKTVIRCLTTERSLKKNFEEVAILQPTKGVIYPGALIFADKELVDGKPRPMTGLPRAPINLRLDLPGLRKEGSFTIADPTNGKVESAVNEALDFWNNSTSYKEGYSIPSRSSFNSTVAYSSEQLALSLGFNAKWASGDAAAQFKFASSSEKNVVVAVYKQAFYSVTFDAPNLPEQFFDASVTPDEAKEVFASAATTPTGQQLVPAYISSVDYGRIIMFRMETDKSTTKADAEAAFKYAAGGMSAGGNASMNYDKILSNANVTVVLMGGNAEVSAQSNAAKSVADLQAIIKGKNAIYSKSNPGVPIAYTVKFLKDNQIAKMGATTDYRTEECQVLNNRFIKVLHSGGYFGEFRVTWDNPEGAPGMWESKKALAGEKFTIDIPADATNVKLVMKSWAGLVGERREAFNKTLTAEEQNKCYRATGTSLSPGWDNKCN